MSPISVAQYLDASFPLFDLVIFDEASQIPTWDAAGAINADRDNYRGGPETASTHELFNRMDEGDDDDIESESTVKDLERHSRRLLGPEPTGAFLKWHYRSRHEALIAFSNAEYYNNGLYTFPSPQIEPAVRFRYVNGVYDRGRSKTN